MKISDIFTIVIIILIFNCAPYTQLNKSPSQSNHQNTVENEKIYKKGRIKLISGEVITGKNLTISPGTFSIMTGTPPGQKIYYYELVDKVYAPVENMAVNGAVLGALAGLLLIPIINALWGEEEGSGAVHVHNEYIGGTLIRHEERYPPTVGEDLNLDAKVLIITASAVAGFFIGRKIKVGWKEIYPTSVDSSNTKTSL